MKDVLPPMSVDAEEAVIGSILIDSDCMIAVEPIVSAEDFFMEQNQYTFKACQYLHQQSIKINQITLAEMLVRMNKLDDIGGVAYLSHLVSIVPTSLHAEYYAGIVRRCSFNRRLISLAGQIEAIGFKNGTPDVALARVQEQVSKIGQGLKDDSILMPQERAEKAMRYYESIRRQAPGIATGISEFDEKTGGLLRGEYIVIAGRGGMGKTTLALKIGRKMGEKLKGLFISLEMSAQSVTNKDIASMIGKKTKLITRGNYSDDTMGMINMAVGKLAEINLAVAEGNRDTVSVKRLVDKFANTHGIDFLIIDYLQKFTDFAKGNENERISYISNQLSQLPKDYNIPVIVLSQLSRAPDRRDDKRPELSDLRSSGSIEQDADMVLFLYRESYYTHEASMDRQIIEKTELINAKDRLRGTYGITLLDWHTEKEDYLF